MKKFDIKKWAKMFGSAEGYMDAGKAIAMKQSNDRNDGAYDAFKKRTRTSKEANGEV